MTSKTVLSQYCTGCGLCSQIEGVSFSRDKREYLVPELDNVDISIMSKVCPASGHALHSYQDGTIWGQVNKAFLGWSSNEEIRKKSSSGGVLTSLCCFLLDKKIVDGIIQTRRSVVDIRQAETIVSKTIEDVLSCMGSRYTTSSPLKELNSYIEEGKRYAFVGKPCDVSALRIYMEEFRPELKKQIIYQLSFFCAGQPSLGANNKLIESLGGNSLEECVDLQYRGNGWPGQATLTKNDGTFQQMDYETSWMKILGRDVRNSCRFCADGTGELADISCGDAWYLGVNGKPDFTERKGRNVIFVRTDIGNELIKDAIGNKIIITENFDIEEGQLKRMQPYHYTRKASLYCYKWALWVCGKSFPNYDSKKLYQFSKGFPLKQKIIRFGGTIQRVIKGTI